MFVDIVTLSQRDLWCFKPEIFGCIDLSTSRTKGRKVSKSHRSCWWSCLTCIDYSCSNFGFAYLIQCLVSSIVENWVWLTFMLYLKDIAVEGGVDVMAPSLEALKQ